jgi:hypothetical protein
VIELSSPDGAGAGKSTVAKSAVELSAAEKRVAVIVLAYNNDWTSWTGAQLYEGALRVQLGKRYARLFVARGKKLSVSKVQGALRAALATGRRVDFMTNTHSSERAIKLNKDLWVTPRDLIRPVLDETGSVGQLDFAANFGCYSDHQAQEWAGLGFRSYVGHEGVSAGVAAMTTFLKQWVKQCDTLTKSVADTNRILTRLFTKNLIYKALYRALGEDKYTVVMLSYGENQSFCE